MESSPLLASLDNGNPLQFRLLTENLAGHFPASICCIGTNAMCGLNIFGRIRVFVDCIRQEKYDVVCLQEVFLQRLGCFNVACVFNFLRDQMATLGLKHHTDPWVSMPQRCLQNSGLVIFSRWPLDGQWAQTYETTAERYTQKGFVCADVALPNGRRERVANTHLDSRNWQAKEGEFQQLCDALLAKRSAGVPLLVCGDFNVCPQTTETGGYDDGSQYAFMVQQFSRLNLKDAWPPAESEPTHGNATLDHIFLAQNDWAGECRKSVVTFSNDRGLHVSDHFGLHLALSL